MSSTDYFKHRLRKLLANREKRQIGETRLTASAVLIPIYEDNGEYHLLFTRRSNSVESHKGDFTFPGGKRDNCDENLLATALRESFEEIGLDPQDTEVLGEFDDEQTLTSKFVIAPFVAFIPYPYEFRINPYEVQEIIGVPLSALKDENNLQVKLVTRGQKTFNDCTYNYQGNIIWGATARIVNNLVKLISSGE
ncbi:MAG: NUDIX hydrolase [Chloroflexota bacterium]